MPPIAAAYTLGAARIDTVEVRPVRRRKPVCRIAHYPVRALGHGDHAARERPIRRAAAAVR